MNHESLEQRIRALEDIQQIRNLKSTYARYCDDNYNAEKIAELFAEDAIWESDALGILRGREEIRKFFQGVSKLFTFSVHLYSNPHIEVDGDKASGRWLLFQPCIVNGRALWRSGIDDEQYQRVDGEWRFSRKAGANIFTCTFEDGWLLDRHVRIG